jgi:hypothetical protein
VPSPFIYIVLATIGPGVFAWPSNVDTVLVDMWGGGGSGGSSNYSWVGGAGGSSAWALCYAARPDNGQTSYTVGAGGAAVIPGGIGGLSGGTTSFGNCRVAGGGPGYPATLSSGGEGGYPGVYVGSAPSCLMDAKDNPIPIVDGCLLDTIHGGQGQASWTPTNGSNGLSKGADAPLGGIGGNNAQCGQPPGSGGAGGNNYPGNGNGLSSGCGAPGRLRIRG